MHTQKNTEKIKIDDEKSFDEVDTSRFVHCKKSTLFKLKTVKWHAKEIDRELTSCFNLLKKKRNSLSLSTRTLEISQKIKTKFELKFEVIYDLVEINWKILLQFSIGKPTKTKKKTSIENKLLERVSRYIFSNFIETNNNIKLASIENLTWIQLNF